MTEAENGKSIADLISELDNLFSSESVTIIQSFEQKLIEFGYMPGLVYDVMYKFVVDSERGFSVEKDLLEIIKWKEIYDCFESIINDTERVVDIIDGMIIKNT